MGLTPIARSQSRLGSLSGERRQVTALFYDVVGSVELLGRLDPEEYGAAQRELHDQVAAVIQSFGGHIDQIRGDGGCAYFGLPTPLEDAAECAIGAALEIAERCIRLHREEDTSLMVRLGVATGMVVVATTATGTPGQQEIIGMAPALAARIQAEAEPNGVLVAESTYRLARGAFAFRSMPARRLKGFADPIRLWQPLARLSHSDRFTATRRVAAPLIGREDELSLCRDRWQQALAGQGQFLIVHGEAGIGKSRLVAELRSELETHVDVPVFQCQPRGNTRPLHPFLDALERELAGTGATAITADDVLAYLRRHGASIDHADAEAIAFLCGNRADAPKGVSWPSDLSTEEIRQRGEGAVVRFLCGWPQPRLIVIEDFHWADSLTEAVVARLPEIIRALPMLVIVTDRDGITAERLAGPNVTSIAMSRLGAGATSRLLDSIWEEAPPAGLAAFIHARSDGVPLFAEQLACLLRENTGDGAAVLGAMAPEGWNKALQASGIGTLQDFIAARLAGLGPLRRLAQVASVIGREFSLNLLARIMEPEAFPYNLDLAARNLVRAGIFSHVATGDQPSARFQHVLMQETAYDSLLKTDRRAIHERIVDLALSGAAPSLSDELMAWHFEQAGRPFDAAHYAIRAATACIARSAMEEADQLLNLAQKQLDGSDAGRDAIRDLQLELLAARGPLAAALYGRGSPQASAVYEQGVALCSAAAGQDRARWLPLYWGWWFTAPNYEAQKKRAAIVVHDMEETADPEVRLQSLHCAWATNFAAGQHTYCLHCVDAGLALYDEERARLSRVRYGGHDARVCGLGERALSLWFTGDDAGSARSIEEALRWAEHTAHFHSLFHALDYAVGLARYRGDHARVVELSERMAAMAAEHAMPGGVAKAKLFGGWGRALLGDAGQGAAHFEEGLLLQMEIGTEENLPIYRDMKAEILASAGQHDEALAILEEAIAGSSRSGQVFWLPELYRRRGLLRLRLGQHPDECRDDFNLAIDLAEGHDARALVARAHAEIRRLDPSYPSPP